MSTRLPSVAEVHSEPLVFLVRSASRPNLLHRVDLECYAGNGECGCERFEFAMRGHLDSGAVPGPRYQCRHIRDAKRFFADLMLERIIGERKRARAARLTGS